MNESKHKQKLINELCLRTIDKITEIDKLIQKCKDKKKELKIKCVLKTQEIYFADMDEKKDENSSSDESSNSFFDDTDSDDDLNVLEYLRDLHI